VPTVSRQDDRIKLTLIYVVSKYIILLLFSSYFLILPSDLGLVANKALVNIPSGTPLPFYRRDISLDLVKSF
jgi:hypothetical protein